MNDERLAVLDVGSNSLRLFCCEGMDADGPRGARYTLVVGLRRGAGPDGSLDERALARLAAALDLWSERLRRFSPARTVAVCTSAVRDAPNRVRVLDLLERRVGPRCHVLSGEQEAGLAFAGASLAVGDRREITVVDVGGGSTELVSGAAGVRRAAVSLQLGAVRQTELRLASDPPSAAELARVSADVQDVCVPVRAALGGFGYPIAVAGTATGLAAIDLGGYNPRRVHRHRLSRRRVGELLALLVDLPTERRRTLPGLQPQRADVITAGAAILAGVLDVMGADEVMVSERDLLDGVAMASLGALGDTYQFLR
ncbi:MAG TPA: hypothetical protein PKE32_07530 [Miltoncostaeaceae bacterium]|nr:hypothetical protein [Miltoncostaeaceae bacterium]